MYEDFLLRNCYTEEVGNASIAAFEIMYADSRGTKQQDFSQLRHQKYDEMVASKRKIIDPSMLPPTPRAAYFHGLRTYHQIQIWKNLSDKDLNPTQWVYEVKDGSLSPIMTDKDAAPKNLLNIIRCACKKQCGNRCSCRKAGLRCASACKSCQGVICRNGSGI